MLHKLPPEQRDRARPLFAEQSEHHLFCAGVLSGRYDGHVLVDDPERPCSALVIKGTGWFYFGGAPDNTAFNAALQQALLERQLVGESAWGILCFPPTPAWGEVLATLVPGRIPVITPRYLYQGSNDHFQSPPPPPAGFDLVPMTGALPAQTQGDLPDAVRDVLNLRAGQDQPDRAAFGFVALQNGVAAAWSMIDCIIGTHGDIGLETKMAFRRQGLGMAVSGATIQYGLTHGLSHVHWDVIDHNQASIHMAQKHGLELGRAYAQHLIVFDEVGYLGNHAWQHLDAGRHQAMFEFCEALLALEKGQMFGHFLTGAAWAGLGDNDKALAHWRKAAAAGWDDLAEMAGRIHDAALLDTSEWAAIKAQIEANASGE